MRESKGELTIRMRREGNWDRFKELREQLRAEGVPAKQAWYQAATEFPAMEKAPMQTALSAEQLDALKGKHAVPTIEAVLWAFENLDSAWVQPADAPSAGAWSLREWARQSAATRTEFYRSFGAKLIAAPGMKQAKDGIGGLSDQEFLESLSHD